MTRVIVFLAAILSLPAAARDPRLPPPGLYRVDTDAATQAHGDGAGAVTLTGGRRADAAPQQDVCHLVGFLGSYPNPAAVRPDAGCQPMGAAAQLGLVSGSQAVGRPGCNPDPNPHTSPAVMKSGGRLLTTTLIKDEGSRPGPSMIGRDTACSAARSWV